MRVLAAAIALLASIRIAAADELVVVAASDAGFLSALGAALAPAGMRVIATTDPPPPVGELSVNARQIAERERATATVWLIFAANMTTLVTYDRDVDRALVREVRYGAPLSPERAAEIAHMARTMLRALRVNPEVDLPVPSVAQARLERERLAEAERLAEVEPPTAAPPARQLAVLAAGGLRVGAAAADRGLEGRLGVAWRPDALGLGLQVSVAPRSDLAAMDFAGRVADDSLAVTGHAPLLRGPNLHLTGAAGGAVHRIRVSGSLGSEPYSSVRYDPAIRLGLIASYQIYWNFGAGVVIWADYLLRRQQYEVIANEPILVVPRLQMSIGIVLTFGVL